ncbi:MAG: glycosyltransferase family 9 protein [Candidatus Omnitrophica bacterium]|nr:glycosyltransferase family 9 protein [Candidatus Omnitrophota bacterium]
MKPSVVCWIDRNFGRPICLILTLHKRFFDLFKKNNIHNNKISKILFIKLVEQGSTVLAYSALKRAVEMVGKENVYFAVFKENRFILDVLNIIPSSNVFEIDFDDLKKFSFSSIKTIFRIRKEKIDAVIDMEFFSRASAIFSYLSGAYKRVGLHLFTCEGPYRGDLLTHKLLYNPYIHTSRFFLSLVEALNHVPHGNSPMIFNVPEEMSAHPTFSPSREEKQLLIEKIEKLIKAKLSKPIIILNPNASDMLPIRRWKEENFIELGRMLAEEFPGSSIIITGAHKEKEKADIIASHIRNAVSLAGHTSLRELLVLYCIGDLLITNDSGPAHFSTLTSIKSVILFGPETPLLYGPLSQNTTVIVPNLVCSPCVNVFNHRITPCEEGACLKGIMPQDVFHRVKKLLYVD